MLLADTTPVFLVRARDFFLVRARDFFQFAQEIASEFRNVADKIPKMSLVNIKSPGTKSPQKARFNLDLFG